VVIKSGLPPPNRESIGKQQPGNVLLRLKHSGFSGFEKLNPNIFRKQVS
jgi:hypothetical protein